ncbi:MAG: hypothetical protein M1839_004476 [Geoglossum umbratile]|nr:MAG: hypothetical protein M1839_004476 [Geoglossum umbratile]
MESMNERLLKDSSENIPSVHRGLHENAAGHPLPRFYLRGLVGVLVPPIVTIYYLVIWAFYLNSRSPSSFFAFGPRGALIVFYSWFIVGVVGLNLAKYGLVGTEAGMMMEPGWALPSAAHVVMHSDHTWSGPGGWLKTARKLGVGAKHPETIWPSRLWWLLALLSSLVFVALPLSGLTMELGSGFLSSTAHPSVVGYGYDNFNRRYTSGVWSQSGSNWRLAVPARVPAKGVIYTPPGFDRSPSFLQNFPNVLPGDDGVPEIFLTSQADVPITGKSWGLVLRYNCSVVTKLSDFTILNNRTRSTSDPSNTYSSDNYTINIQNASTQTNFAENLVAASEIGATHILPLVPYNISSPIATECYYNARPNNWRDYLGLGQEEVLEFTMWQYLYTTRGYLEKPPPKESFRTSVGPDIPELKGAYKEANESMPAIGVRCTSSSAVGTADINGEDITYTNFQQTDTPIYQDVFNCAPRLTPYLLTTDFPGDDWLSSLFSSIEAPPTTHVAYASEGIDAGSGVIFQLSVLQGTDLRKALLRKYAAYAVQLLYNGGHGFSGQSIDGLTNPNATAYQPGKVLQRGVIPPALPAVLLVLWSLGSLAFGCYYGFRRRWAATLDGYSMFRFGADLAEKVRDRPEYGMMVSFEECEPLRVLPGLVGDARPRFWPGHIALVRVGKAAKGKLYM